jgi:hypothetical protein
MTSRSSLVAAVVTIVLLLMAGCAARVLHFDVNGSALRDVAAPEKRTYVLYPGIKDVDPNDLQFKEFSTYVHRALLAKGFAPAKEGSPPEIVIFLSYGIGEPKTTYYSYPIIGQIGGGMSTFSASTYGSGGYAHTTGTVTSFPQVGVVATGIGARRDFFRWAVIEAVDVAAFAKTQKIVQLWRTPMTSSGSSGDLRLVFPVMVAAGQPYMATDTGRQVQRTLTETSPEVLAILGEKKPGCLTVSR